VDIYLTASLLGKYPPLFTSTSANNCLTVPRLNQTERTLLSSGLVHANSAIHLRARKRTESKNFILFILSGKVKNKNKERLYLNTDQKRNSSVYSKSAKNVLLTEL